MSEARGDATRQWDANAMLDALPEMVNRFRVDDLVIVYCNAAWAAQYGLTPVEAIGRRVDSLLSADGLEGLHLQLDRLGPDDPILADVCARASEGGPGRWTEWVDQYVIGPNGPEVLSVGRDVTDKHRVQRQLAESEALFRDLADNSSDVVWRTLLEPSPHFDYVSPSVERILGYPPSYFIEDFDRFLHLVDEEGREEIRRARHEQGVLDQIDLRLRHANGSIIICETRTTAVQSGLQGVSRDVTELRHLQDTLAIHALRDPLTGLANRRLLDELLGTELERTQRAHTPLAVAYIDVDGLKLVNDEYGHEAGDAVLRETARRLRSVVRGADVVARIGGDEFVVVYEPTDPIVGQLVDRLETALSAPIEISADVTVRCPASIGTADTRVIGYHAEQLIAAADDAMYQVKRARRAMRPAQSEARAR